MCKYTHIYVCACVYIWVYIYLYILLMEIKLAQIRENTQDSLNKQKVFLFVPALHELVSSEKVMELQTQNCIQFSQKGKKNIYMQIIIGYSVQGIQETNGSVRT